MWPLLPRFSEDTVVSHQDACWCVSEQVRVASAEDWKTRFQCLVLRTSENPALSRSCAKPNQTLCIKHHRPGIPKAARLCQGAWQRMWEVRWYSTATCSLKLTMNRVMLTKSNTAQEQSAIPDLEQKAKGWCNVTRVSSLHISEKERGLRNGHVDWWELGRLVSG